jgi:hypothetical protein
MQSEVELDETIREFKTLPVRSTSILSIYKLFIEIESFQSLVGLLVHENIDLSLDVLDVLLDLFDLTLLEGTNKEHIEYTEGFRILADAFVC